MSCRVRKGETCPTGLGRGKHAMQVYGGETGFGGLVVSG